MKAKITRDGNLEVERTGSFRPQMCPFISGDRPFPKCGDHCPLFQELVPYPDDDKHWVSLRCAAHSAQLEIIQNDRKMVAVIAKVEGTE